MTSGVDRFEFAGFWRRVATSFLDLLIWIVPWYVAGKYLPPGWDVVRYLAFSAVYYPVTWFLIVRFGGTPGKLILGLRVVDGNGNYLSPVGAVKRDSLNILLCMPLDLWLQWTGTDKASDLKSLVLTNLTGLILFVDVLGVAFNKRKRALHDFIAGSYVVTKRSLDRVRSELNG